MTRPDYRGQRGEDRGVTVPRHRSDWRLCLCVHTDLVRQLGQGECPVGLALSLKASLKETCRSGRVFLSLDQQFLPGKNCPGFEAQIKPTTDLEPLPGVRDRVPQAGVARVHPDTASACHGDETCERGIA